MKTNKSIFFIFLVAALLLTWVSIVGIHNDILGWNLPGAMDMRWGIDIRGGVDAVFTPKDLENAPTLQELESARAVIETRLDQQNILDREVKIDQASGDVIVRFPWKTGETAFDPGEAIAELGAMAQLTFVDPDGNVILTGADVKPGAATWGQGDVSTGYYVNLELTDEGGRKFAEATGRLIGQTITTYMDDIIINQANVMSQITGGKAIIQGMKSVSEVRELANQINAGALPFALVTSTYQTISPTLGSNALEVMVLAGLISFLLLCIYMIFFYRLSGVITCIALLIQLAGTLLMLSVPQITVTLPGLAGIILTLGMGVDANILIAERIREELKAGKALDAAITAGFKRAFSAVLDGNLTTLIVAIIMMIFGSGTMLSFAYTLIFGIIMNFVAGVFANRMMTQSITRIKAFRKNSMFLSAKSFNRQIKTIDFFSKRKLYVLISGAIILLGVVMIFVNGVKLDINFSGGAIYRYNVEAFDDLEADNAGKIAGALLDREVTGQVTVNTLEDNKKMLVLNIPAGENITNEDMEAVEAALLAAYPESALSPAGSNNVSSAYGQKFLRNGAIAILLSSVLMVLYVWFSFRRIHGLSAGAMALLALLHDVVIVFFSFVIFGIPLGDTFIAVVLTILGYSINDTVVIYDRVRENALFDPSKTPDELMNISVSQVLVRSLNTSLTLFFVIAILYVLAEMNGLDSITAFALPMAFGTISGCYSTLCIASPLWAAWQKRKHGNVLAAKR